MSEDINLSGQSAKTGSPSPSDRSATLSAHEGEAAHQDSTVIDLTIDESVAGAEAASPASSTQRPTASTPRPSPHGGKLRFPGQALGFLGSLYWGAEMQIHALGSSSDDDFVGTGEAVCGRFKEWTHGATYCVKMLRVDEPRESYFGWSSIRSDPDLNLSWWDFANILRLGEQETGKLMVFTAHTRREYMWLVTRQIPGREYNFLECLDVLRVEEGYRERLEGFGPANWPAGAPMPTVYMAKDLDTEQAVTKIRNIMRNSE